jgi:hypothetical protein
MEFTEYSSKSTSVPEWASYLISFGYRWMQSPCESRRIALISLPGDSAGAGLVALGVVRKCLELELADDASVHYARLKLLAAHNPDNLTLRHATEDGVFCFDTVDATGMPWVSMQRKPLERRNVIPLRASNWRIYDEPFIAVGTGARIPFGEIYRNLINNAGEIIEENLMRSFSQVCLAVRAAGKTVTRDTFSSVSLRLVNRPVDLASLLTVSDWSGSSVSRLNAYTTGSKKFDRVVGETKLVIADGHESFLRILDERAFKHSDVIGVYDRVQDRSKLEEIGLKLESLRGWYDDWDADDISRPPNGIHVKSFIKR